jgi:hypothetical protein
MKMDRITRAGTLVAALLAIAGGAMAHTLPAGGTTAADTSRHLSLEQVAREAGALPVVFVKTNLLQGAGLLAPNLGVEVGLGRRTSLDITGAYRSWDGEKLLSHAIARVELRGWHHERFYGHFLGVQALAGSFEIKGHDILTLFEKESRYEGSVLGASLSYGYHLVVGRRWGIEFSASGGMLLFNYDKFDPANPGTPLDDYRKLYTGLTDARVSLVFMIK